MTNQEAIEIIKTAIAEAERDYPKDCAAAVEAVNAMDIAVKALERQDVPETNVVKWISVKDRLPPMYHMVLITGKNSDGGSFGVIKGSYDGDKCQWYRDDICKYAVSRGDTVTHWMPFPEPPKEDGQCTF